MCRYVSLTIAQVSGAADAVSEDDGDRASQLDDNSLDDDSEGQLDDDGVRGQLPPTATWEAALSVPPVPESVSEADGATLPGKPPQLLPAASSAAQAAKPAAAQATTLPVTQVPDSTCFFLFTLGNDYHHDHVQHDRYRYRHNCFNHDQIHNLHQSFPS